jgi:putative hydrolase of the HAD superfamily
MAPRAILKVMHKAIIFDLGKVLLHFDFERGYQALEGFCPYAAAEIPQRIATTDLVERLETGLIDPPDFVRQLSAILDLTLDYDQFCGVWNNIFTEPLIPESMLEGLAARYRLLLLSNTNAIHFEMIRRSYPMLRHFHDMVLSYEVRAMKPRREIYEAAIQRAGCLPQECFYTDDIARYAEAARAAGMDAVQFSSREQLERELLARDIRWE